MTWDAPHTGPMHQPAAGRGGDRLRRSGLNIASVVGIDPKTQRKHYRTELDNGLATARTIRIASSTFGRGRRPKPIPMRHRSLSRPVAVRWHPRPSEFRSNFGAAQGGRTAWRSPGPAIPNWTTLARRNRSFQWRPFKSGGWQETLPNHEIGMFDLNGSPTRRLGRDLKNPLVGQPESALR